MAVQVEVIGKKYYSRINGVAQQVPIGTKLVVKGVPKSLEGKLKVLKEVPDDQLIVNDNPEAAKLRDEGKPREADKKMAEDNEKKAAKGRRSAKPKAETGLPQPEAEK